MNVSSRWCVTAVFAFGALACSDPVPPPAQGAFIASIKPASPPIPDRSCPTSAVTYDVPSILATTPTEVLDADNYTHKIINGEKGAEVSCTVKKGGAGFTFSGHIQLGVRGLSVSGGTLGADMKGTATMTVSNGMALSSPLLSATGACTVDAAKAGGNNFQVQAGSMWARYTCPAVLGGNPGDGCASDGYIVLENCAQ